MRSPFSMADGGAAGCLHVRLACSLTTFRAVCMSDANLDDPSSRGPVLRLTYMPAPSTTVPCAPT